MGTTSDSAKTGSEDTCVICLSTVTERAIVVPCNHYTFDFVCLVSWLQERSTCPLCKVEVSAVQYDWRSPSDFKSYTIVRSHPPTNASSARGGGRTSLFAPYGLPRRQQTSFRANSPPAEDPALRKRREVYRRKLFSLHIGSNEVSGYRDITPQMIANSTDLQSRARAWIRRELRVFNFLHMDAAGSASSDPSTSGNAEFLLAYVVSIIMMVDLRASNGHAQNLLAEFLGRENSQLFLHELHAYLRSPYTKVEEWDRDVQYMKETE
ncbi:hypothetical protein BKA63DRAFT_400947 [Paraphoma chrysanthemicola]|nr:hypothetical protein BKA63DRAFT_400947 [Paraphoma chrysanthemicola]